MAELLNNGHVLTDEDVDTARLIKQINDELGVFTDDTTLRIAATPLSRVRQVVARDQVGTIFDAPLAIVPESVADVRRSGNLNRSR